MRGAPHYDILLWIENAPVVGIDRPEDVSSFIQDRIKCHIPDSNTSPNLNSLVTKYQMHLEMSFQKGARSKNKMEDKIQLQASHGLWFDAILIYAHVIIMNIINLTTQS